MRMKNYWLLGISMGALALLPLAQGGETPGVTESGRVQPQKVGEEAKLLLRKVSLEFVNTPLHEALGFMQTFAQVVIGASQATGNKAVTLKLPGATLAEAFRQIKDQAGAVYRLVDGKLLLASPAEWAAIDAGKGKFESYVEVKIQAPKLDAPAEPPGLLNRRTSNSIKIYTVEGKNYTAEELQKERPEVWESLQESAQLIEQTDPQGITYRVQGKSYTAEQLQKEHPAIYEQLQKKAKEDGK